MFARKAGAYLSEAPLGSSTLGQYRLKGKAQYS